MQQIHPTIDQSDAPSHAQVAASIPPAEPDEAAHLAQVELQRFLTLLESLNPQDWEMPTHCTRWNVRQVVAHLAGATAIHADWDRLLERCATWTQEKADQPGQTMAGYLAELAGMSPERRRAYREAGFNPLDTLTQFQVDERAEATSAELIGELRAAGPASIANRRRLPEAVRSLQLPVGTGIKVPVGFFVDVILPRDMWMHRMEIALATDRAIVRAAEHEGRLTALVMHNLSRRLAPALEHETVAYRLSGPDGGDFLFGPDAFPAATPTMDTVDFHLLASGRLSPEEARSSSRVRIDGDAELGGRVLSQTTVPY